MPPKMENLAIMRTRIKSHHIVAFSLIALLITAVYLTPNINRSFSKEEVEPSKVHLPACSDARETNRSERNDDDIAVASPRCDLFSGRWVYNDVSPPLYEEGRCSFMPEYFACEKYGRKDLEYQKWRWQPHHCDLPRFNGTALLEKIRGKRLVFVGDSLNKNQWTSLLCLIESSLDQSSDKSTVEQDNLTIFKATEYNATIEFYWSPLLVESNCDDLINHSTRNRTIRINSIEKHARQWTDADILIFDTFTWWLEPSMTLLWGSFGSPDAIYKRVEMKLRRYEMALTTWSDWLEVNLNRTKTKLFFMSISPDHFYGENLEENHHCYNETEPILKEGYWGVNTDREMMIVAESILQKLEMRGINITYLNITSLSDYRKDAHPSIYRKVLQPLSDEHRSHSRKYSDCVHWCLPGVPDVWNQIFYSYIIDS